MFVGILAALSAAAAAGMRIALPLLAIGLLQNDLLWQNVPLLSRIHPQVLVGVLTSWSLFELFGSKKLLSLRALQLTEAVFSPIVGALLAITAARIAQLKFEISLEPLWAIGIAGAALALVLKLVEIGWFFRLQRLPIWTIFAEDILCVFLVLFSFNAPQQGGLIALFLLSFAVRSSREWYLWYRNNS